MAAEQGIFLERGTVIRQPLPTGTLTRDDRGIMPWMGRAVFICSIPWEDVRHLQQEEPWAPPAPRAIGPHCYQCGRPGAAQVCTRCWGHLCEGCAHTCQRCAYGYCETCRNAHGCNMEV